MIDDKIKQCEDDIKKLQENLAKLKEQKTVKHGDVWRDDEGYEFLILERENGWAVVWSEKGASELETMVYKENANSWVTTSCCNQCTFVRNIFN